jgi:ribosomal protein S18 acetylase RimI-like enzyme
MTQELVLRPIRPSDRLGVLHVESGVDLPWDWQDHREFLANRKHATAVVTRGKHILGFVCLEVTANRIDVIRLAVSADSRRERIGSYLLWYAAKNYVNERRPAIEVTVNEYNVPAQLFLRANGFQWVNTKMWADDIGEYTMRKDYRDE